MEFLCGARKKSFVSLLKQNVLSIPTIVPANILRVLLMVLFLVRAACLAETAMTWMDLDITRGIRALDHDAL